MSDFDVRENRGADREGGTSQGGCLSMRTMKGVGRRGEEVKVRIKN